MSPTISIIIPVYNQEKYLSRCLDSVLAQTFTDFEVICVNDHSTDSTAEILKEYSEKDSRIVLFNDPGKGVSDARNFGIDNAKGKYIGFVDSDDYIQPQMYEFMLKAITENNCNMVVCEYEKTENPVKKEFDYCAREYDMAEFTGDKDRWGKDELVMSGSTTKLVKTDFLKENARFQKYKIGEDTLFCAQLWVANRNERVVLIDIPLYSYFMNNASATKSLNEERFICLAKTREKAYEIYSDCFPYTAEYFLIKCFLLLVRCKKEKLISHPENKKELRKLFFKTLIPFIKVKGMGFAEKIFNIKSYLIG